MALRLTVISLLIAGLFACKNDAANTAVAPTQQPASTPVDGMTQTEQVLEVGEPYNPVSTPAEIADKRAHCGALIDSRSKEEKAYSMMVVDYFHHQYEFNGKEIEDIESEGRWFKFEDNFTYTFGKQDNVEGKGRYHFSLDNMKVIMMDDTEGILPQEWTIQTKEDFVVFVGSTYFGPNSRQIKIIKKPQRPGVAI